MAMKTHGFALCVYWHLEVTSVGIRYEMKNIKNVRKTTTVTVCVHFQQQG